MVGLARQPERVLVIGDDDRQVQGALAQVMPGAQVVAAANYFEAIAELAEQGFSAIVASAEPIERRPESAVRTLRQMGGEARLILFGHPTLEPLSRKMMEFGCDDYLVTPVNGGELHQVFGTPVMRIAPPVVPPSVAAAAERRDSIDEDVDRHDRIDDGPAHVNPLSDGLPIAEICLSAMTEHPTSAVAEAVKRLDNLLGPGTQLIYTPAGKGQPPVAQEGQVVLAAGVRSEEHEVGQLHLIVPAAEDANAARHTLSRLSELVGRMLTLQERHTRLQKLAITDELTGLYNGRWFKHFLSRVLDHARSKRFPVTLFIFDIDNFKRYNDQYGHAMGDEILKQTATLMRRCVREHDLVARIGGDEFAVVFWEKDGPRQPKEPRTSGPAHKHSQEPVDMLGRFRRLLAAQEIPGLGQTGKGVLTISGGLAVYPYDARNMEELIAAADNELMMRAKKAGKNSIFLVGNPEELQREAGEG